MASNQTPTVTIADLARITAPELATLLLDPTQSTQIAVIDVRDSDHLGGHIKDSAWIPTDQLDMRIPELIRIHRDKDKVVFHCMLSQQRGPASALKFARALQKHQHQHQHPKQAAEENPIVPADQRQHQQQHQHQNTQRECQRPEVCILEGGFGVWQARYGTDERLTEAYVKDLWD